MAPLHETDPTGPEAERTEPAVGEVVDAARTHREKRRRARVEVDDRRAKIDCLGLSRQDGKHGKRVLA